MRPEVRVEYPYMEREGRQWGKGGMGVWEQFHGAKGLRVLVGFEVKL